MNFSIMFLLLFSCTIANATALDFLENGITKPVKVDTSTPANTKAYPYSYYSTLGVKTEIALDASLLAMSAKLPASLGAKLSSASLSTVLASDATLPLPTGASTEATLSSLSGKFGTLGQKTMAGSAPVVLSSDQTLNLPSGASTSALQTTGNASLTSIDGKVATETTLGAASAKLPATLGQKTMAASMAVTVASDQAAIPVTRNSVTSTANSSVANLGISAVFTGTSEDVRNYSTIVVNVFADQASATNGLSLQQSSNGTNWDVTDVYSVPASTGKTFSIGPAAAFFRLVYANGAVATTNLRIQVVYHLEMTRASSHSLNETITLQNDAELSIAQVRATNGTNSVPLIADAAGNLAINSALVSGTAIATGNGVASAGTQRVTVASDNTAIPVKIQPLAVTTKQAAISIGTTAVRLTTDAAAPSATRQRLNFMLDPASAANCYMGSATVTTTSTTRGLLIFPGATQEYVNDANDYYLICDVAAQTVFVTEAE